MSDDFDTLTESIGSGLPSGATRTAVEKARGLITDDDDDEQKRRKRRRDASAITKDFAPTGPNPFAINSGI